MLKNSGINFNSAQIFSVNSSYSANTSEATPNPGEHRVLTKQKAFVPQRAKERSLAEALQVEYAASNAGQSILQKTVASQGPGKTRKNKTHKWPPKEQFSISSDSDSTIKRGVKTHAIERKIPEENIFSMTNLSNESLAGIDLTGRLTLHGHGSSGDFEDMTASELAQKLADAGLKKVGVLKIKACYIGEEDYLEKLKEELSCRGIKVGYLSAPEAEYVDQRLPIKIAGKKFNLLPIVFMPPKYVKYEDFDGEKIVSEKFGLKTIKGNVDISFKGTRYNIPSS